MDKTDYLKEAVEERPRMNFYFFCGNSRHLSPMYVGSQVHVIETEWMKWTKIVILKIVWFRCHFLTSE